LVFNEAGIREPPHHSSDRRRCNAKAVRQVSRRNALPTGPLELIDGLEAVLDGLCVDRHLNDATRSQRLSPAMSIAAAHASTMSHGVLTTSPICPRLDVNCTSGTTENESCRLSTPWLSTSKLAAPCSP